MRAPMASLPQESSDVGAAPDVVDILDLEVEAAANVGRPPVPLSWTWRFLLMSSPALA